MVTAKDRVQIARHRGRQSTWSQVRLSAAAHIFSWRAREFFFWGGRTLLVLDMHAHRNMIAVKMVFVRLGAKKKFCLWGRGSCPSFLVVCVPVVVFEFING